MIPVWFDAVKKEISAIGSWASDQNGLKKPLKTIFFGGGTPSLVDPALIAQLIGFLGQEFKLARSCEITLEANPGTLNRDGLKRLVDAGINRISLGLQAAQPRLLKSLGRIHSPLDFVNSVKWADQAGIKKISADIMLGLPGQTVSDIDETLNLLFALPVGHVSYYSLIIEENTPFYDIYSGRSELLPDDNLERQLYHHTIDRLQQMGMQPYEISNASLPGEKCLHNLVYWHADSYYGFGPAAHSYLAGVRRGNTGSLDDYLASVGTPFGAVVEEVFIDETERQKETMLLGLRLLEGVSFDNFRARHGVELLSVFNDTLISLSNRGLVDVDEKCVRLSKSGLDFANQVFMEFV